MNRMVNQKVISALRGLEDCNNGKCFFCGDKAVGFKNSSEVGLNYWFCSFHSVERNFDSHSYCNSEYFSKFKRKIVYLCKEMVKSNFTVEKENELDLRRVEADVRKAVRRINC